MFLNWVVGALTGFYSSNRKFARHSLQCVGLIIYLHIKLVGKKLMNHGRETWHVKHGGEEHSSLEETRIDTNYDDGDETRRPCYGGL